LQGVQGGKKVLMIEQEAKVGGACVHRGTIPSKTLRETAVAMVGFQRRSGNVFNVAMSEDMQVASLMKRLEQVIKAHEEYLGNQLRRSNVEIWHGRAKFISPTQIEVLSVNRDTKTAEGKILVIATGSCPRNPKEIAVDHDHILDSDSILSMIYLPASLTVLGAGVIATEYASIFASLGVQVTVIDKGARPLSFLDPELTERFVSVFEEGGNRYLGGRVVKEVKWDGVSSVITKLEDGEEIKSDKCLFALGRVANLKWLNIEAAGLKATDRGLVSVNENYQTSVPHIYAVGDVIGPPSLASSSMHQGRCAIRHALDLPIKISSEMIPTGIYAIPEMSSVGLTEEQAIQKFGSAVIGRAQFSEVARGHIAEIQEGFLKMVADPQGKKLLGVHIIGEGATDLVHLGQMALSMNADVDLFIENIFNFPTLTEAYRVAALDMVQKRKN
jgi:NAD(P) transhydrogenase